MLDKRTLDTIRSQAEAGEFAHYGGMMVQDLLNHIDALTEQVRVLHDRIEALEVQLAAMSDYVGHLTTQLTEGRNALQELEHRAFRYTLDAEPFWGIEDDVMQRLRLALSSLEVGS